MTGYYNEQIFDNRDTLDGLSVTGLVGSLAGSGLQTLFSWLGNRGQDGANCLQGQVSGDASMTACVPYVMSKFDELEAMEAFMAPQEVIAAANEIASVFSNPQYFNQTIGGRSRDIREQAKIDARTRADAIIERVSAAAIAAMNNPAAAAPTAAGLDTTTILMYGGAALLAILLIKN